MARKVKKGVVQRTLLSGIPDLARSLFVQLDEAAQDSDYLNRISSAIRSIDDSKDATWDFGLLHDTGRVLNSAVKGSGVMVPVVMAVTSKGLIIIDAASMEIQIPLTWDRMCRIDVKPFDDGEYQIFGFSYFTGRMTVRERFLQTMTPLDRSEVAIRYLYTHSGPAIYDAIDGHWQSSHIPQEMHRLPDLLR